MSSARQDEIKAALEAIRIANGGRLTREAVVAAARSKRHALHSLFDWDDRTAAHTARLDRAQEIIVRYVTLTVVTRSAKISTVFYVKDPRAKTNEPGYIPLASESIDDEDARAIVTVELDRCRSSIERARNVAAVLDARHPGLSVQLQAMLEEVVTLAARVAAAA
jgi:hypothetical protein